MSEHHRTHKVPPIGHKFSIAVSEGDTVVGVAIIGRPEARLLQDGWTAEVVRCCTDGTPNVASMLYAAAWRACRALGYKRLITYTLDSELGTCISAAGWKMIGQCGGGSWNRKGRPRVDKSSTQQKIRWEAQ